MPLYEMRCPDCLIVVERRINADETDSQLCHECGEVMELLVSRPAWFPSGKYGKGGQK